MSALRLIPIATSVSLIFLFATNNAHPAAQSVTGGVQTLDLGKPVQREIGEGETHSYRVRLAAGEFLHVYINQRGVNVAATLLTADGKKLIEADAPRTMQEPEWITHVAVTAGDHTIEVRTVGKGAPTGRYEIKIEEQRRSAVTDEARLSAQKAFTEGTRLLGEKNYRSAIEKYQQALALYRQSGRRVEEAVTLNCLALSYFGVFEYQAAIERYKEALSIYGEVSDVQGQGFTLNEIGDAYFSLNRYDEAISYYEQALQARRKAGYRAGEGGTLYNLGEVYRSRSRYEKAIEYFEHALAISREVKDRKGEGWALRNLGHAYKSLDRYETAIEYYKQALPISQDVNDRAGEASSLVGLGNAYNSLSQYEKAIEHYERALAISRQIKYRAGEGNSLVGLGNAYHSLSRYEKAIEYLEQALTHSREGKSRVAEGRALNNLGNAYSALGRYEKAIEYFEQSLAIKREVGDRAAEGNTLGNLGTAYNHLRRYQKAIEYYEQQLAISREVKNPAGEGHSLWGLGDAHNSLSQYEKAIVYYEQALVILRDVADRAGEGEALKNLGFAYQNQSRYEKAIENYERALAISREVKNQEGEGNTLNNLMLAWERQNNNRVAIFYGKQAVNVYQEIRGNITTLDKESRQSYLKAKEDAYRALADLLISEGRLPEAEEVLALLKEEEYSKIVRRAGPLSSGVGFNSTEAEGAKISDQLVLLARERGAIYARLESKTATNDDRRRMNAIDDTMKVANGEFRRVLAEIAKAPPPDTRGLEAARQSQSLMPDLRKLGQGTVALYTVVAKEKGWVMMVTADSRKAYSIDINGLEQTIARLRETLKSDRYDPLPFAQKLYQMLMSAPQKKGKTLAEDLRVYGANTLMWSLDGVLRYVPVSVLHDGKTYLLEKYTNVVFTTASVSRLNASVARQWRGLGLGVSKPSQYRGKEFPALPGVERELRSIISEQPANKRTGVLAGQVKLDEAFNKKAMIDGLREGFPVVLIASHFSFNTADEAQSFLLLGDRTALTLEELQDYQNIFEKVELLTLSACDTAVGGANGKEVEGLAYLSQTLGAKAVVASLWPVADTGAEVLMREFYHVRMKQPRITKAQAFQRAQLDLLLGKERSLDAKEKEARSRGPKVVSVENSNGLLLYKKNPSAPFAHPHYWAPFILIGNWK